MAYATLLTALFLATPSFGYYMFRSKIPNGETVPHPCKANYMWGGVGHTNPDGGGERNVFGKDFKEAGFQWTEDLCRYDSDGDGKSNGEELGDPDCTWREGTVPERVTDITHPGVCNPYGVGDCQGRDEFVDCEVEKFEDTCDVINNPEVMSMDFRFKEVTIPNTETNYYCQLFDLPSGGDYHVIAEQGVIDNQNVVHHMLLYACPDEYKGSPSDDSPNPCDMGGEGGAECNVLIGLWTVGLPGNCYGNTMGFRVGATGYKKVRLEIHYNNPTLVEGYTDTSGMRIYYQPARPDVENLATFTIGQNWIQIPPGKASVQVEGSCPGDCTKQIATKPMYVVSAINHMHYMGRSQKTEVIRNGQVVKVLADDARYDYDSPVMYKQEEPFEVLPGDELKTTCTFSSMSKKRWVFYGDATSDEMCFAFIILYPFDALLTKWCASYGPLSTCDMFSRAPKDGCDWARFANLSNPEMTEHYLNVEHNCNLGFCRPECQDVVKDIKDHPCVKNEQMYPVVSKFLEDYHEGAKFIGKIHSCDQHDHDHDHDDHDDHDDDGHDGPKDTQQCRRDCGHICHDDGDGDWEGNASPAFASTTPLVVTSFIMAAIAAILF